MTWKFVSRLVSALPNIGKNGRGPYFRLILRDRSLNFFNVFPFFNYEHILYDMKIRILFSFGSAENTLSAENLVGEKFDAE